MMHHLVSLSDGLFTGRAMSALGAVLSANKPEGHAWISGVSDWQSQRVDLQVLAMLQQAEKDLAEAEDQDREPIESSIRTLRSCLLVDYIPPSPGPDHEWSAARKRWVLRASVAERQARRSAAMSEIERLELQKLRPLGDLRLAEIEGRELDQDSVSRLKQIESRLTELRGELSACREIG